jgi:GntR family transcriptional regulator / MocR family aminotransferase
VWNVVTTLPAVELHVRVDGRGDRTRQVYQQVRAAIADGLLRPGEAVPSSRELARRLGVARNTVTLAYDRLTAEGFLRSRVGAGTFVCAEGLSPVSRPPADSPLRPQPVWDTINGGPDMSTVVAEYDFRSGIPDASRFPFATWRALLSEQIRTTTVGRGAHIGAEGVPALRAAIARHVGVSRGVRADPEDVLVTSGSQQAIDLVGRVLLAPGDVVAVESPGYPPPWGAFTALGCRVVAVPVDAEGLVVDALPADARLVYVCPSHQFPLGMVMSLRRRRALLDWAERVDAAIIEDDYDSEFRFGGRPLEPLHRLDSTGRVLYVGSLSKVLLPTLRLGFVIAPPPLHEALRKAKHVADWHTSVPLQAAAATFIEQGHLARHIRRMRGVYTARHLAIQEGLAGSLAAHLEPIPSAAGLHIAARLRAPADEHVDTEIVARAEGRGVVLQPLSMFRMAGTSTPPGLMFGYGAIDLAAIPEGLRRLRACLDP